MKEKIFIWLSRTFSLFVPCGISLYIFVIEKLLDNEVSFIAKLGAGGIFVLAVLFIVAVIFYGKHLNRKLENRVKAKNIINDELIITQNTERKNELIAQRILADVKIAKAEASKSRFKNLCVLVPFILMFLMFYYAEQFAMSMYGILGAICISMAIGFGFNEVVNWLRVKGAEPMEEQQDE